MKLLTLLMLLENDIANNSEHDLIDLAGSEHLQRVCLVESVEYQP
jgi:hypothetical protein